MALRKLERRNYGGGWPVSIKYENLYSFKDRLILLCQRILETRRKTHLHCSPHFTIRLNLIFDLNLRQWNLPQMLIDQVWFSLFFVWDYQWKTGRYFFRTLSLTENIVYPIPQLRNSLWKAIYSVQKTLSKQQQM